MKSGASNLKPAAEIILEAWRAGRPIVPFLGAGISAAAGFPTIARLTTYLASVQFALENDLYGTRYPISTDHIGGISERYRLRPSEFIADFGWPEMGQLTAALRRYLRSRRDAGFRDIQDATQSILLSHLKRSEKDVAALVSKGLDGPDCPTLNGSWEELLDHLTEGQTPFTDALFTQLEERRSPHTAHVFLAFLSQLLGIRLILTLNFDTLLERALSREAIEFRTFDVHRDADLPHSYLVRRQFSILKLHGSAYGLRFGERLRYPLDEVSRTRILRIVPPDALLIVLGFSGLERRMMQLIDEVARRGSGTGDFPSVLWLTTSTVIHKRNDTYQRRQICDANSFLKGLYCHSANSFPASRSPYRAIPGRPPVLRGTEWPDFAKSRDVLAVTITDATPATLFSTRKPFSTSSSWPSLAAAECVAAMRDRDCIWIDVGNHQSVEAVIRDLLDQIHGFDPLAPDVVLTTDPSVSADERPHELETELLSFDTRRGNDLFKAAERVQEALQRGRYVVVFDSMESFCRPALSHHGLPNISANSEAFRAFANKLTRLSQFIERLIGFGDPACEKPANAISDTLFLITATAACARHNDPHHQLVQWVRKSLRKLFDNIIEVLGEASVQFTMTSGDASKLGMTDRSRTLEDGFGDLASTFNSWCPSHDTPEASKSWAAAAAQLAKLRWSLRDGRGDKEPDESARAALLLLLSVFRRTSPKAIVKAFVARWANDSADGEPANQLRIMYAVVDATLELLAQKSFVILLEDDTVLLHRRVMEFVYDRLTGPVRLRHFGTPVTDAASTIPALISGLITSTMHLHAARVYFVDVYKQSHDQGSFFEYVYHRISALRYLAIVEALVRRHQLSGKESAEAFLRELDLAISTTRLYGTGLTASDQTQVRSDAVHVLSDIFSNAGHSYISTLVERLGIFAFVRNDTYLRDELRSIATSECGPSECLDAFSAAILASRHQGLATVRSAIRREEDRIRASTTPDSWLIWINDLIAELHLVTGSWSQDKDRRGEAMVIALPDLVQSTSYANLVELLRSQLKRMKLSLLRDKVDFQGALVAGVDEVIDVTARYGGGSLRDGQVGTLKRWIAGESDAGQQALEPLWARSRRAIYDFIVTPPANQGGGSHRPQNKPKTHLSINAIVPTDQARVAHVLRCWFEVARAAAGQGDHEVAKWLLGELDRELVEYCPSDKETSLTKLRSDVMRTRSDHQLREYSMWFRESEVGGDSRREKSPTLAEVCAEIELETHRMEDFIRATSRTAEEYASRRSEVFSLRARVLYLRRRFREAHRVLDTAVSDLRDGNELHRTVRAIALIFQAELLSLSAAR